MDLTSRYVECYNRFCRYLIDNNIVDVDEDVLLLLLQNDLRESLGKCKMGSTNKNVCRALIKTGQRKGEECGKIVKGTILLIVSLILKRKKLKKKQIK
jgi:hypothetical protein